MIERISVNLTIKSLAQDERAILEATKKNSSANDKKVKEDEEAFNQMIDQRVNEEKNRVNIKKKIKKQEDVQNLFVPMYAYQPPVVEDHYLIRLKNHKKKKCAKCGELFESEVSKDKCKASNINICENCLNKDIENFLRENYL